VRYSLGGGVLALWAVVLLGGLKARLNASTAILFLTGAGLAWTLVWLYRGLAALAAEPALDPAAGRLDTARRRELDREKRILLKAIKELEFDHAMGKLSASDCQEIVGRYRTRAIAVLRQLDEGELSYRELIEREVRRRLGPSAAAKDAPAAPAADAVPAPAATPAPRCPACATLNDADAAFCKRCGTALADGGTTS
jgi:hypothetical protein